MLAKRDPIVCDASSRWYTITIRSKPNERVLNMQGITLLKRREIEARLMGAIYKTFCRQFGRHQTIAALKTAIQSLARENGCDAATRAGGNSLVQLHAMVREGSGGGALDLDMLEADRRHLSFDVKRCGFAEMYERLGLKEIGSILSCDRDAATVEGFNDKIEFQRSQTIMEGADHCDFRYRMKDE